MCGIFISISSTSTHNSYTMNYSKPISSYIYIPHIAHKMGFHSLYTSELEFPSSFLELVHHHFLHLLHIIVPLHIVHKHIKHAKKSFFYMHMQCMQEMANLLLTTFLEFLTSPHFSSINPILHLTKNSENFQT